MTNNLVLNITREATPDPYVTYANGAFYLVRQAMIMCLVVYSTDQVYRLSRRVIVSKYGEPIPYQSFIVGLTSM